METVLDSGIVIKTSLIPDSGNGLFTTRDYKEGEVICDYTGEILTFVQAFRRRDKSYMMGGFGINVHIDARNHPESMGRYINDPRNPKYENVKFRKLKVEKKALIVALRDISVCSWFTVLFFSRRERSCTYHTGNPFGECMREVGWLNFFPLISYVSPQETTEHFGGFDQESGRKTRSIASHWFSFHLCRVLISDISF
jgi:hypothetical protein